MTEVLETLTSGLDPDLKRLLQRRSAALMREIEYVLARDGAPPHSPRPSRTALEAIADLNSFYQIVISPLRASAPRWSTFPVPIAYGNKLLFDQVWARRAQITSGAFFDFTNKLGISPYMLMAPRGRDVLRLLFEASQP